LRIGFFHPALNVCGGAEWVAVNIINAVKASGNEVVVLTNEKVNQRKIETYFGTKVLFDTELVFPLEFFATTDLHNVYTDAIRTLILKSKCDALIDTYSNALLPGVNITYVHFPFAARIPQAQGKNVMTRELKNIYYLPYLLYEHSKIRSATQLILGNSRFTVKAIREKMDVSAKLLYPPIPNLFFVSGDFAPRSNTVVSVARISPEKSLTMIPQIASLTNKDVQFLIIGIKASSEEFRRIVETARRYKVADRVKIMTNVPRSQLMSVLRKSKVLLHPAIGEHFGVSIAEAMACGCIPIVHNSGGPMEFVPKQYRFVSVAEAAEKVNQAVLGWSPRVAAEFTMRAQQFNVEHFSESFLRLFDSYLTEL